MPMDILTTQKKLKAAGFDPGPLDGIRGRLMIQAIKTFQASCGLEVDGIVGPATEAALNQVQVSHPQRVTGLVWLDEAQRLQGVTEVSGPSSNIVIMNWAEDLDIHYPGDDVPWCGLFTGHCIASSLPEEPLPDNPLGARNWLKFGKEVNPAPAAVMVFWRISRTGPKGHVGFYVSEDHATFHILGGNQSNQVNITKIAKDRLLGARWPLTAGIEAGGAVDGSRGGTVSYNEQ